MGLTLRQWMGRIRRGIVIATSVSGAVITANLLGGFNLLEWAVRDEFFHWRIQEGMEREIVIVTIDETDLNVAGSYPISDRVLAQVIKNLRSHNPTVIGLNLYRDLPQEPGHQQLVEVFRTTPNLIGVEKTFGNRVKAPPVLKQKDQVAFTDVALDSDRKIRRAVLSALDNGTSKDSLAAVVAMKYLESKGVLLKEVDVKQQKFQLGQAVFLPIKDREAGYPDEELGGYQILINWRGPMSQFPTIPMRDVLAGRIPPDLIRDRIVLIGSIAPSSNDYLSTPYSTSRFGARESTPSVVVWANIVSQLIRSAMDGRPLLRGWSGSTQNAWIILWAILGTAGLWGRIKTRTGKRLISSGRSFWSNAVVSGLLFGGAYLAFLNGIVMPVIPPLISFLISAIAASNMEKFRLRRTLERYVAAPIVQEVLNQPEDFQSLLEGRHIQVAILFCDIRGFTTLSYKLPPKNMVAQLNTYLNVMVEAIITHRGTLDKFIGDAVMAEFGFPLSQGQKADAMNAIRAALEMRRSLAHLRQQWAAEGKELFYNGIGISYGEVIAGNIGCLKRLEYTVIGDVVNVASRVEGLTKNFKTDLLITESIYELIVEEVEVVDLGNHPLRGREESFTHLYSVICLKGEDPSLYHQVQEELAQYLSK